MQDFMITWVRAPDCQLQWLTEQRQREIETKHVQTVSSLTETSNNLEHEHKIAVLKSVQIGEGRLIGLRMEMSGNKRTFERQKWKFERNGKNPIERYLVPLPLARTICKIAQLLSKSWGCSASSPTAWILLRKIFDGLTHVSSAAFFLALDLMCCLSAHPVDMNAHFACCVCSHPCFGRLDFAHSQEIPHVSELRPVCICTHPRLYFLTTGCYYFRNIHLSW